MKYYELTTDEEKLLKDIEAGNFKQVKKIKKAKAEVIAAAKNTLNKTKNINIRIPERVIARLKAKAAMEGIPYQTLASSILHRFVSQ